MADKKAYLFWNDCAAKVNTIAGDKTLPLWRKGRLVSGAYVGLALEGLQSKHRRKIISGFSKVNAVLANYKLDSFDDYENISDEDLYEIIRLVKSIAPN
ncbi:MAG: hypothetical protein GY941_29645 [Planctomycetes bacterium]|nr:hypothetical protein [Planctomycetota bacterium]